MKRMFATTLAAAAALAAAAMAAAPAQAQYYGGRPGWDRGFERHAVNSCRYEAQRRYARRGGARVDIRDVQFVRRDRVRVLGAVAVRDLRRGDRRWDRGRDRRWGDHRIAFSCEVRSNGRVSRFRTHNYRW